MQRAATEFCKGGTVLVRAPMGSGSGELTVTAHAAGPAPGERAEPGGQREEWRVLRFRSGEAQASSYIQSVARVSVGPGPSAVQIGGCLPLLYARSMVAVSLAALAVIGAPVLTPGRPLRVLCIGLGGGPLASHFAHAVPHCSVDAVELSPEVLAAAREGMGFAEGPRLRAILGDGAAVARGAAEGAAEGRGAYDAVLIDAADEGGRVPDAFLAPDGDFASALAGGLLPLSAGLVAANLQPEDDPAWALGSWARALAGRGAGTGFCIREPSLTLDGFEAPGTGNIVAVQLCGERAAVPRGGLPARLAAAAAEVQNAISSPYDLAALAVNELQ